MYRNKRSGLLGSVGLELKRSGILPVSIDVQAA